MHRLRISLMGPSLLEREAADDLRAAGALPLTDGPAGRFTLVSGGGLEPVLAVSRDHDRVTFYVEHFEEHRDRLTWSCIAAGDVVHETSAGVVPEDWGTIHDEDGRPLDRAELEWAGRRIHEALPAALEPLSPHDAVVAGARELADFTSSLTSDEPRAESVEGIIRLGALALRLLVADTPRGQAERAHVAAFRITQSVVHARASDFVELPGHADWRSWSMTVAGSAAALVDEAAHAVGDSAVVPLMPQPCRDLFTSSARSLLTTCVEALALFASPAAVAAPAST